MKTDNGFVVIHRRIWEHPAFNNAVEASMFIYMVTMAAWRPTTVRYKGRMIDLQRGQLAVSVRDLAAKFGGTRSGTHRFLERVRSETMIETDSGTGVMIVTICNYSKYQDASAGAGTVSETGSGTKLGQDRDKVGTRAGHRTNKGTNKQGKEDTHTESLFPVQAHEEGDALALKLKPAADIWNEELGEVLPKVQMMTDARAKRLRPLLNKFFGGKRSRWRAYCQKIRNTPFLLGAGSTGWKANFDWAIKPQNVAKVLEGNYDDSAGNGDRTDFDPDEVERQVRQEMGMQA